MKRSMSSLDVAAWKAETLRLLGRSRVGNIYTVGDMIIVKFKAQTHLRELLVEPGRRIHLTSRTIRGEKLGQAGMVLRKYLRGKVLEQIEQQGFERVVQLVFQPGGYRLVVELLPRGVAALLDPEGRIIYATRYVEMRDRAIRRGEKYVAPPRVALSPLEATAQQLLERVREGRDLVRGLIRGAGWPPELAEEVLHRLGIDKSMEPGQLDAEAAERILEEARRIYKASTERPEPTITVVDGRYETVTPFKPTFLAGEHRTYGLFNEALDEYFHASGGPRETPSPEEARLLRSIEEARRRAEEYLEKAAELEEKANKLAANILEAERLLECVSKVREREGWKAVKERCPGVVEARPKQGIVVARIGGVDVELDVRLPAQDNLLQMYRRAGELRGKARKAEEALRDAEKRLEDIRRKARLRALRTRLASRPREWFEKYHWLISSEGLLVLGGRNADQNESLVKKQLGPRDVFMHAEIHGAPAVVIKCGGKQPGEETLREAATLAACYSKAWKSSVAALDVYWTWGEQVSKSPPPGEYLSKGAFMVYGKRNYIRGVRLELALGVELLDEYARVIVGPPSLVEKRTSIYVVLVPGDLKGKELVEKIKKALARKAGEHAELVEALPDQEIESRVPGPSRVLR